MDLNERIKHFVDRIVDASFQRESAGESVARLAGDLADVAGELGRAAEALAAGDAQAALEGISRAVGPLSRIAETNGMFMVHHLGQGSILVSRHDGRETRSPAPIGHNGRGHRLAATVYEVRELIGDGRSFRCAEQLPGATQVPGALMGTWQF